MTRRDVLPSRRRSETVKYRSGGRPFIATIGYFDDGRIGEIFFASGKCGSDADIAARDLGIAVSLALQHGCSVETLRHACLRNLDGSGHEGPLGALLDMMAKEGPAKKEVAT